MIGRRTVLTAGHCHTCATRLFVGGDVREPGLIVAVAKAVRHPDYREAGYGNDLMVLLLEKAVDGVVPRRRPPAR